jgi:hypothetical protein
MGRLLSHAVRQHQLGVRSGRATELPVTNDPARRRSGMAFPDFWKSFFLAFADGKAKSIF